MDWRLVAAPLAALVVLTGGTLLAGQVQGDLDAGVKERAAELGGAQTPPLQLNDLTLPKDVPLELPEGAEISPDLSKLTLPEDVDLQLPSDLDLGSLDFELPEDFQLDLPEGTIFSPPGLTLPEGATMRLPDGRTFTLPPGSRLDLPPEVVERLLAAGLPSGRLPADRSFDMSDLPPDLLASLDPPSFEGAGRMRLPGGTTITLPEGQRFPFPAGLLPYAIRYLLPAGTTFDIPMDLAQGGSFPVPQPGSSSQLVHDGAAGPRIAVETEITNMPSTAKKGEPFTVSGYVRERASGKPVAGAPVDVFLNESKRATGTLVGQATTDAAGIFTAKLRLPDDKPAREYQLVNHAVAFDAGDGRAFADGWGDPPITATADTALTLLVPARDGFGVSTTIAGALVDNTGHPVAGMPVAVSVDGVPVARPVTNAQGRFAFQHGFDPGEHAVEAQFLGAQAYRASPLARATIAIDDDGLDVPPIVRGTPGGSVALTGRLFADGALAPARDVSVRGPFDPAELALATDGTGRFSYATVLPAALPPGTYTLTYRVDDLDITKTQTLEVNQTARIVLSAPSAWDVEVPAPMSAQLLAGTPPRGIPGQMLRFTLAGPGGARDVDVVTDESGTVSTALVPLRAAPGTYTLAVSTGANPNLDAQTATASIALGIFDVSWEAPRTVVRGTDLAGAATLRFGGKPYADTPITLDVGEPLMLTTDANGRVEFTTPLDHETPLGPLELRVHALDHPIRSRNVTVMAMPRLTLDGPAEFPRGGKPDASITLTDDQGEPLRDRDVLLRVGNFEQSVTTDRRGRWSGTLDVLVGEDNVTLAAQFDEESPYLAAQDAQVLVASAQLASRPPPLLWIAPLVGLALVGAGGAGWYAYARRRRAPAPAAAPAAVVLARHAPDFDLRLGIPDDEPAVWGVGEPLAVTLRNRGRAGGVELRWEGGATRLALEERATATLTFRDEGEVRLRARRDGAPSMEEAEALVRIVDYRKETAREFDLFVERARSLDATLTRRSTPREIQGALTLHLGAAAEAKLDEMALVMEETNYSHHAVGRAHYLRFVRASRALDPFFDEGA